MSTCPVKCKYCAVSEVRYRAKQWEKKWIIGLNKAATILNPPLDMNNHRAVKWFYKFDLSLLDGDKVGFNAITDPFWSKYSSELAYFLERVPERSKAVICVTKFPITRTHMRYLAKIPNFLLNVSITGLDKIERTKTKSRLQTLEIAKEYGVKAFPIIHPYIHGMSDLSFLPKLKEIGYDYADIKGLRYDPVMDSWMPNDIAQQYRNFSHTEALLGNFQQQLDDAGITVFPLKKWTDVNMRKKPSVSEEVAIESVKRLVQIGNITSSATDEEVIKARIVCRKS